MKKRTSKLLSLLLTLAMVLGMLPAMSITAAAADPGETADNPVVCTTFAEFKAAMENTDIIFVKLTGVSGSNGDMPSQESLAAAIENTTYKELTIEGENTFTAPLNGMNDCLIWPRNDLTINGTGTLKYVHGNTGGTGAVINMTSNVSLKIDGNVTLEGGANGTSFGYAIFAQAGTTKINGGSFIGYNAMIANNADMSAVTISGSANLTINGGNFSASLHPSSPEGKKAHSLSIASTPTGTISIKAGTFSQGIDIRATGKTIETCGYFDTAKASITAGGSPVEATASTDVLENTEVIVTDTSVIESVAVAVTTPVAGAAPATPSSDTANVTVSNHMWTKRPDGTGISSFEAGKIYRCQVILNPASGYTFKSNATVTIGGQTATIDSQTTTWITAHVDFTTPAVSVSSVAISVTAPTAGATPSAPTTSTANVSIVGYQWKISGGSNLDSSTAFEAGKTYRLEMTINPTSGHTLSNTATATVNGNAATVWDQSTSYLNCYYEFTIPAAVVPVSSVAITVTVPTAGATQAAPTTSTANVSIVGYQWKISGGSNLDSSTAFEAGKTYRLEMTINPTTGQTLSNTATATVNGNAATVWDQSTSYLNCYYEFTIPAAAVPVSSVAITVTVPTAGAAQSAPTTSTENVRIVGYQWKLDGNPLAADATFEAGNTYRLEMTINPTTGQTLSNTATATVNGNAATAMDQNTSYLNCYYDFTVESTIDTIAATITPPVAGATPDLNLGLPSGVQICTSGSNYWSDMSDGTGTGTVMTSTDTYIAGKTYRCRFTVETKPGYVFTNPISAVTLNGNATTISFNDTDLLVFDATFVAAAAATEYVITVTDGKATNGAGIEISKAAEYTTITLTANAAPADKVFDKWVVEDGSASITLADANSATTTFAMPAGAVSVKATYKEKPATEYTVTVQNDGNGSGSATPATAAAGTEITLSATANSGYHFKEWQVVSGGVTIANNKFTMPASDVTVKAIFEKNSSSSGGGGGGVSTYAITVDSAKNGDVTSSHKSAAKGTTVTLTVEPDKGFELDTLKVVDKNGDKVKLTEKSGKYTFTMPASKVTVKATFAEIVVVPENPFVDVPADAYYYDAVLWAAKNDITGGVDDTHFAPNATCTRAQAVTFLWRAAGSPAPKSKESSFADVAADAYYSDAVRWAVENGITSGTSATTFSPNADCSRAQIVTFLHRCMAK